MCVPVFRRRKHRRDDVVEISDEEDGVEIVSDEEDDSGPSDFDASGGSDAEDEDAIIERRRRERQAKMAKLAPNHGKPTQAAPRFEKVSASAASYAGTSMQIVFLCLLKKLTTSCKKNPQAYCEQNAGLLFHILI